MRRVSSKQTLEKFAFLSANYETTTKGFYAYIVDLMNPAVKCFCTSEHTGSVCAKCTICVRNKIDNLPLG